MVIATCLQAHSLLAQYSVCGTVWAVQRVRYGMAVHVPERFNLMTATLLLLCGFWLYSSTARADGEERLPHHADPGCFHFRTCPL